MKYKQIWLLTGLLALIAWLLAAVSESHIIVTMELKMKERNMFLWREILWQLRLLEETNRQREGRGHVLHNYDYVKGQYVKP